MLKDSLLVNLNKYPKREAWSPDENFLTEAFAWFLRNHKEAQKGFLKLVKSILAEKVFSDADLFEDESNFQWETQVHKDVGFIDLLGSYDNQRLIIEIKIDSGLSSDQIKKYRECIENERNVREVRTVLITRNQLQHTQECDCSLIWAQVYETLNDLPKNSNNQYDFAEEFMALLDHHHLTPAPPINLEALNVAPAARQAVDQILVQLKALKVTKEAFCAEAPYPLRLWDYSWGRLGMRWVPNDGYPNTNWTPALFSGLLVDPTDHQCGWLTDNQTIFAFIVSVGSDYWKTIENNRDSWNNFVRGVEALPVCSGWNVYNPIEDNKGHPWNRWHRLIIWKTLTEWMKPVPSNSIDIEVFMKRYKETTESFINSIGKVEAFRKLQTLLTNESSSNTSDSA